MARKGIEKVRTGCVTCKIRKVKCDEARPHCLRCTSTGRACDGYRQTPPGAFSWGELLAIRPSNLPGADHRELRSLAFFCEVVAPVLSGPLHASFWTHHVVQVAHREAAAKHAVVTIAVLYEQFSDDPGTAVPQNTSDFALGHYNKAIKQILALHTDEIDTFLLVSILFVCIELLRGEPNAVINHLKHGINVLRASPRKPELSAIYSHLSIILFFFGGANSTLPLLDDGQASHTLENLTQVQTRIDWLSLRILKLVRTADYYRLGIVPTPHTPASRMEQHELMTELDAFASALSTLTPQNNDHNNYLLLHMRWLVCKIWASTCLAIDETIYDEHVDDFKRIIDLANQALQDSRLPLVKPSKFILHMGFSPLLHFVVIKCRVLRLRLTALSLMKTLSCSREILWDVADMYAVGVRIIEIEHSLEFTPELVEVLRETEGHHLMPSEERRIKDSVLEEELHSKLGQDGQRSLHRRIRFFVATPGGGVGLMHDWVKLQQ
ncbi:hypothetical protein S7711_03792 [Stachybotrys chartarum IBT 7711]|uniref:Zn(2)-C6 fungal-type domain-containing protein n=1 Tax=Stachybotrys chartarum (strain CBS 109288 / IBT 7711) TaxID=1280523 RepID=A0A084AU74_STACB|nr:hypothetical protein S7711_03792 [Stachybotrys chartarum IBT 7711]